MLKLLPLLLLASCCTHKCNDMPKWKGYALEFSCENRNTC